ncbi:6659_t:CDS:1, partial [Gigaspora rosea]
QEWKQFYEPIPNINKNMFVNITQNITLQEVIATISKAPLKKATGPSTIFNEILKKLPPVAHELLTKIFNTCLQLKTIPQKWRASLVWPISKKPQYNGDLTSTRPIKLIDHTRKILTKILTERLSNILLKLDILVPQNN